MRRFLTERLADYEVMLEDLGERTRPIYEEESTKADLRAKIYIIKEALAVDSPKIDLIEKQLYRVELVDYIDAHSEHEAIDIFTTAIPEVDLADDSFDVYAVDPLTRKAVTWSL